MVKKLLFVCLFCYSSVLFAQDYLVYHEQSTGSTGCGSFRYTSSLLPGTSDAVSIGIKVANLLNHVQARVYYTTDGSNPSGTRGVPTGTTQVVNCDNTCSNGDNLYITGTVPAQPAGTVVKYIFSVWNGSGYEVFGNSLNCAGCSPILISTNAAIFTYAVQGVLPISYINFTAKEGTSVVRLYWSSAQESNMDRYEVYRSKNSLQFEKIGSKAAIGNSSLRTDYSFDDAQPLYGNNYYKITAFDKQGKFVSTKIIRVLFGKNDNSIIVFSNPAGSLVNIRVVDIIKGDYLVRVFDNGGRLLCNSRINHNGADAVYPVQLPRPLARGNYRLVLSNKYQFFRSSFIVQ